MGKVMESREEAEGRSRSLELHGAKKASDDASDVGAKGNVGDGFENGADAGDADVELSLEVDAAARAGVFEAPFAGKIVNVTFDLIEADGVTLGEEGVLLLPTEDAAVEVHLPAREGVAVLLR